MAEERQSANDLRSKILGKGQAEGVDALNGPQRIVYLIVELEVFTIMEGLIGFYSGMGGDRAMEVPDSLEQIGAVQSADLVRRANALFPDGRPPSDEDQLHGELNSLEDETRSAINEIGEAFLAGDYDQKLIAYITANQASLAEGL